MQRILILDDDPDLREMLKAFLSQEEYAVDTSASGSEAEAYIAKQKYAVVLVDIFLPDMSGVDFVQNQKKSGCKSEFIFITGSSDIALARKAVQLGVFDYLVKPFKNSQLLQVVRNAIMKNHLQEEKESLERQKVFYQQELEKQVEQKVAALRESESKYQNLVEQSLVGVFIIQDNTIKYANQRFCEILECSLDETIQKKTLTDFIVSEIGSEYNSLLEGRNTAEKQEIEIEFEAKTESGAKRFLKVWAGVMHFQGKEAIEGILIDATEEHEAKQRERKLELELINEHKLAAIGQLAAGIAHNLNTPIAVIQGNAELLQIKHPDMEEPKKILNQTNRMNKLIETLIQKGRKEQLRERGKIDINELLGQELEFLNANLFYKHKIEKVFEPGDNLPTIEGIYSDFSQSFLNIIQNSIDAMYESEKRQLSVKTWQEDGIIVVSISDTGCGIPEEIKSRVFEPFFTTKPTDIKETGVAQSNLPRGTGLGLSLVHNLLSPYGVKIDFESRPNEGTTFYLRIPVNIQ